MQFLIVWIFTFTYTVSGGINKQFHISEVYSNDGVKVENQHGIPLWTESTFTSKLDRQMALSTPLGNSNLHKLRSRVLSRWIRRAPLLPTQAQAEHQNEKENKTKILENANSTEIRLINNSKGIVLYRKSRNGRDTAVGEARTFPMFLMAAMGFVEFVVVSGVGIALAAPIFSTMLLMMKLMFKASLIMIG